MKNTNHEIIAILGFMVYCILALAVLIENIPVFCIGLFFGLCTLLFWIYNEWYMD